MGEEVLKSVGRIIDGSSLSGDVPCVHAQDHGSDHRVFSLWHSCSATFEPGGLIHAAPATPEDEAFVAGFVAAFRSDHGVRAEIEELKRLGYRDEGLKSIPVGGGCGFAGCDSALLVAQLFSSEGVNPRTTPVLALVSLRQPGGSYQVQRVEFAPKKETTAGLEIERVEPAPQPKLEIQEKIPPPPVQLEVIPERRTLGP